LPSANVMVQDGTQPSANYQIQYPYQTLPSSVYGLAGYQATIYGTASSYYSTVSYQSVEQTASYPFVGYQSSPQMSRNVASFKKYGQGLETSNISQANATVEVEYRAIYMGRLNSNASEKEVRRLVVETLSRRHPEIIQQFSRGTHSDNSRRSHAILVMDTVRRADQAVAVLDGKAFQGQKLKVKIAAEGVVVRHRSEQTRSVPSTSMVNTFETDQESYDPSFEDLSIPDEEEEEEEEARFRNLSSYRTPPPEEVSGSDPDSDEDESDVDEGCRTEPQRNSTASMPMQSPVVAVGSYMRSSSQSPTPVAFRYDCGNSPRHGQAHQQQESTEPSLSSGRRHKSEKTKRKKESSNQRR
jgi:hypothetical protein